MKYGRTFNFSAGPAMMPEPVLEEIKEEMLNYRDSGMCVMEMSHRSPEFQQICDEAVRDLMNIPFVTASQELDAEVVKATKAAGYENLKGHKSVGGLRASIYKGVEALVDFLKKFEEEHK